MISHSPREELLGQTVCMIYLVGYIASGPLECTSYTPTRCVWKGYIPLPKLDSINLFNVCQTDRQRPMSDFTVLYLRTVFFFFPLNPDLVVFPAVKGLYCLALGTLPCSQALPCHALWCIAGPCWSLAAVYSPSWVEGELLSATDIDSHHIYAQSQIIIKHIPHQHMYTISLTHTLHITYKIR